MKMQDIIKQNTKQIRRDCTP